jgi:ribosome maturation factor RimP
VGSAGIGQPFKVLRQNEIHVGEEVEVLTCDGKKLFGVLKEVSPEQFVVTTTQKVKKEGQKRPQLEEVDVTFAYADVKYTKYVIDFK